MKNYEYLFSHFSDEFSDRELESITPDEILSFLTKITDGNKQTTKRNRYSSLKAFFNFIKNSIDINIQNPCDTPILRKIFKDSKSPPWPIIEKELIDEIIFKTTNPRNRIMLELMARGGMRVGEVLKIRPIDAIRRLYPTASALRIAVSLRLKLTGTMRLPLSYGSNKLKDKLQPKYAKWHVNAG